MNVRFGPLQPSLTFNIFKSGIAILSFGDTRVERIMPGFGELPASTNNEPLQKTSSALQSPCVPESLFLELTPRHLQIDGGVYQPPASSALGAAGP